MKLNENIFTLLLLGLVSITILLLYIFIFYTMLHLHVQFYQIAEQVEIKGECGTNKDI